jgi:nucleotide-binding universal stress UspA family protein
MRGAEIVSVLSLQKPSEGATIPTPPPDVVAHLNRTPTASPRTTSKVLDKVGTADVLRRRAAQMQADLLVMGGWSRRGLPLSLRSHTARSTLRSMACPVLLSH